MNDQQKQVRFERWRQYRGPAYRRWRVYSTFLTGLAIGLFYVLLVSGFWPNWGLLETRVLVLIFSGILGGVIYTILVDGHVEMPRFVAGKGDKFEAGLFGDILLGIAGAVVLDFIAQSLEIEFTENLEVAAAGIVGGYGGRAILQFALQRVFKDINLLEADRQRYLQANLQANLQRRLERMDSLELVEQLNQQIESGLSAAELGRLTAEIKQAELGDRQRIYKLASEFRRKAKQLGESVQVERSIPIFEALVESDSQKHQYYAELAFAHKDSGSSDWVQVIQYLDRAIALRGNQQRTETWNYELSRAITRIQAAHEASGSYDFDPAVHERIIADLLAVAEIYNLENILKEVSDQNVPAPIFEWMQHNQTMLAAHPKARVLLRQLDTLVGDESVSSESTRSALNTVPIPLSKPASSPQPSIPHQPAAIPVADETIPQAGIALIKEFEGYAKQRADGTAEAYADELHGWEVATIGYGTTRYPDDRPVKRGDVITHAQAEEYLLETLKHTYKKALEKIPTWTQMNTHQRAALYSFAYNLGANFYQGSNFDSITRVCDSPNRWSDKAWVEEQFVKYRNPGSSAEAGLRRRRIAETNLFCQPVAAQLEKSSDRLRHQASDMGRAERSNAKKEKTIAWMEAVQETWLKRSPEPEDLIPNHLKKRCTPGDRYEVESYQAAKNNHYFVKLAYGAGDWYILDSKHENHWDTTWKNDHREEKESGSSAAEDRLEQTKAEAIGKQPVGDKLTKDMPFDTLITPHITYGEFALYAEERRFRQDYQCKTAYEICVFLEKCREHFGDKPIVITSGYRPPEVNSRWDIRGAADSEHLYDNPEKGAVDFYIKGLDVFKLERWCDQEYPHSIGYGAKKGFVHLGFRPGKERCRWPY